MPLSIPLPSLSTPRSIPAWSVMLHACLCHKHASTAPLLTAVEARSPRHTLATALDSNPHFNDHPYSRDQLESDPGNTHGSTIEAWSQRSPLPQQLQSSPLLSTPLLPCSWSRRLQRWQYLHCCQRRWRWKSINRRVKRRRSRQCIPVQRGPLLAPPPPRITLRCQCIRRSPLASQARSEYRMAPRIEAARTHRRRRQLQRQHPPQSLRRRRLARHPPALQRRRNPPS